MGKRVVENVSPAIPAPAAPPAPLRPSPVLDRLALAVTYVVSPLTLPPVLFGLVLGHFRAPPAEVGWTMLGALVFFGLIPLGYVARMVRSRRAASLEVRDRARRVRPFLVGLASSAAAFVLVLVTPGTAKALVAALVGCIVVNTLAMALVTLRRKISIHAATTAGFVSMLAFVALTAWVVPSPPEPLLLRPATVLPLLLLVPLVMWARVRTGAHTRGEVWAGALFGLAAPYAALWLLLKVGLFDAL